MSFKLAQREQNIRYDTLKLFLNKYFFVSVSKYKLNYVFLYVNNRSYLHVNVLL